MTSNLLLAIALMLIMEGVIPFVAPNTWRETFRRLIQLSDGQLRFIGLTAMLAGLILIVLFK